MAEALSAENDEPQQHPVQSSGLRPTSPVSRSTAIGNIDPTETSSVLTENSAPAHAGRTVLSDRTFAFALLHESSTDSAENSTSLSLLPPSSAPFSPSGQNTVASFILGHLSAELCRAATARVSRVLASAPEDDSLLPADVSWFNVRHGRILRSRTVNVYRTADGDLCEWELDRACQKLDENQRLISHYQTCAEALSSTSAASTETQRLEGIPALHQPYFGSAPRVVPLHRVTEFADSPLPSLAVLCAHDPSADAVDTDIHSVTSQVVDSLLHWRKLTLAGAHAVAEEKTVGLKDKARKQQFPVLLDRYRLAVEYLFAETVLLLIGPAGQHRAKCRVLSVQTVLSVQSAIFEFLIADPEARTSIAPDQRRRVVIENMYAVLLGILSRCQEGFRIISADILKEVPRYLQSVATHHRAVSLIRSIRYLHLDTEDTASAEEATSFIKGLHEIFRVTKNPDNKTALAETFLSILRTLAEKVDDNAVREVLAVLDKKNVFNSRRGERPLYNLDAALQTIFQTCDLRKANSKHSNMVQYFPVMVGSLSLCKSDFFWANVWHPTVESLGRGIHKLRLQAIDLLHVTVRGAVSRYLSDQESSPTHVVAEDKFPQFWLTIRALFSTIFPRRFAVERPESFEPFVELIVSASGLDRPTVAVSFGNFARRRSFGLELVAGSAVHDKIDRMLEFSLNVTLDLLATEGPSASSMFPERIAVGLGALVRIFQLVAESMALATARYPLDTNSAQILARLLSSCHPEQTGDISSLDEMPKGERKLPRRRSADSPETLLRMMTPIALSLGRVYHTLESAYGKHVLWEGRSSKSLAELLSRIPTGIAGLGLFVQLMAATHLCTSCGAHSHAYALSSNVTVATLEWAPPTLSNVTRARISTRCGYSNAHLLASKDGIWPDDTAFLARYPNCDNSFAQQHQDRLVPVDADLENAAGSVQIVELPRSVGKLGLCSTPLLLPSKQTISELIRSWCRASMHMDVGVRAAACDALVGLIRSSSVTTSARIQTIVTLAGLVLALPSSRETPHRLARIPVALLNMLLLVWSDVLDTLPGVEAVALFSAFSKTGFDAESSSIFAHYDLLQASAAARAFYDDLRLLEELLRQVEGLAIVLLCSPDSSLRSMALQMCERVRTIARAYQRTDDVLAATVRVSDALASKFDAAFLNLANVSSSSKVLEEMIAFGLKVASMSAASAESPLGLLVVDVLEQSGDDLVEELRGDFGSLDRVSRIAAGAKILHGATIRDLARGSGIATPSIPGSLAGVDEEMRHDQHASNAQATWTNCLSALVRLLRDYCPESMATAWTLITSKSGPLGRSKDSGFSSCFSLAHATPTRDEESRLSRDGSASLKHTHFWRNSLVLSCGAAKLSWQLQDIHNAGIRLSVHAAFSLSLLASSILNWSGVSEPTAESNVESLISPTVLLVTHVVPFLNSSIEVLRQTAAMALVRTNPECWGLIFGEVLNSVEQDYHDKSKLKRKDKLRLRNFVSLVIASILDSARPRSIREHPHALEIVTYLLAFVAETRAYLSVNDFIWDQHQLLRYNFCVIVRYVANEVLQDIAHKLHSPSSLNVTASHHRSHSVSSTGSEGERKVSHGGMSDPEDGPSRPSSSPSEMRNPRAKQLRTNTADALMRKDRSDSLGKTGARLRTSSRPSLTTPAVTVTPMPSMDTTLRRQLFSLLEHWSLGERLLMASNLDTRSRKRLHTIVSSVREGDARAKKEQQIRDQTILLQQVACSAAVALLEGPALDAAARAGSQQSSTFVYINSLVSQKNSERLRRAGRAALQNFVHGNLHAPGVMKAVLRNCYIDNPAQAKAYFLTLVDVSKEDRSLPIDCATLLLLITAKLGDASPAIRRHALQLLQLIADDALIEVARQFDLDEVLDAAQPGTSLGWRFKDAPKQPSGNTSLHAVVPSGDISLTLVRPNYSGYPFVSREGATRESTAMLQQAVSLRLAADFAPLCYDIFHVSVHTMEMCTNAERAGLLRALPAWIRKWDLLALFSAAQEAALKGRQDVLDQMQHEPTPETKQERKTDLLDDERERSGSGGSTTSKTSAKGDSALDAAPRLSGVTHVGAASVLTHEERARLLQQQQAALHQAAVKAWHRFNTVCEELLYVTLRFSLAYPDLVQALWETLAERSSNIGPMVRLILTLGAARPSAGLVELSKLVLVYMAKIRPEDTLASLVEELTTFRRREPQVRPVSSKVEVQNKRTAASETEPRLRDRATLRGETLARNQNEINDSSASVRPTLDIHHARPFDTPSYSLTRILADMQKGHGLARGPLALVLMAELSYDVDIGYFAPHLPVVLQQVFLALDSPRNATVSVHEHARTLLLNIVQQQVFRFANFENAGTIAIALGTAARTEAAFVDEKVYDEESTLRMQRWTEDRIDLEDTLRSRDGKNLWEHEDVTPEHRLIASAASLDSLVRRVVRVLGLEQVGRQLWADEALTWALNCPSSHLAARSFQQYRALATWNEEHSVREVLVSLLQALRHQLVGTQRSGMEDRHLKPSDNRDSSAVRNKTAKQHLRRPSHSSSRNRAASIGAHEDSLIHLSDGTDINIGFILEILFSLQQMAVSIDTRSVVILSQLYWGAACLLHSDFECVFEEATKILSVIMERVDFSDQTVQIVFATSVPSSWVALVPGLQPMVMKGLFSKSAELLTVGLLGQLTGLASPRCDELMVSPKPVDDSEGSMTLQRLVGALFALLPFLIRQCESAAELRHAGGAEYCDRLKKISLSGKFERRILNTPDPNVIALRLAWLASSARMDRLADVLRIYAGVGPGLRFADSDIFLDSLQGPMVSVLLPEDAGSLEHVLFALVFLFRLLACGPDHNELAILQIILTVLRATRHVAYLDSPPFRSLAAMWLGFLMRRFADPSPTLESKTMQRPSSQSIKVALDILSIVLQASKVETGHRRDAKGKGSETSKGRKSDKGSKPEKDSRRAERARAATLAPSKPRLGGSVRLQKDGRPSKPESGRKSLVLVPNVSLAENSYETKLVEFDEQLRCFFMSSPQSSRETFAGWTSLLFVNTAGPGTHVASTALDELITSCRVPAAGGQESFSLDLTQDFFSQFFSGEDESAEQNMISPIASPLGSPPISPPDSAMGTMVLREMPRDFDVDEGGTLRIRSHVRRPNRDRPRHKKERHGSDRRRHSLQSVENDAPVDGKLASGGSGSPPRRRNRGSLRKQRSSQHRKSFIRNTTHSTLRSQVSLVSVDSMGSRDGDSEDSIDTDTDRQAHDTGRLSALLLIESDDEGDSGDDAEVDSWTKNLKKITRSPRVPNQRKGRGEGAEHASDHESDYSASSYSSSSSSSWSDEEPELGSGRDKLANVPAASASSKGVGFRGFDDLFDFGEFE